MASTSRNTRKPIPKLDVVCLPLPPTVRQKLLAAGYRSAEDLANLRSADLAAELSVTLEDASDVLHAAFGGSEATDVLKGSTTAAELLVLEKKLGKIITFCGPLDQILGGGICVGQITEFCGEPAIGKTQLCIQLAVDVQIPSLLQGISGQAVYIDTEGSFCVERAKEIAEGLIKHLHKVALRVNDPGCKAQVDSMTWESVLENIHYFRITDLAEQLAALAFLPTFLDQHLQVKLVIIDSLAFHLRQDFQDAGQRSRLLSQLAQDLMNIAADRKIAIVLTNHVTTKFTNEQTKIVPALGDSWAHAATNRVILYWKDHQRMAFLYKSPSLPARTAEYLVTKDGVRGHTQSAQKRARPPDVRQI